MFFIEFFFIYVYYFSSIVISTRATEFNSTCTATLTGTVVTLALTAETPESALFQMYSMPNSLNIPPSQALWFLQ